MFHGFYNLASGMLSQNRNLNVISDNMVNVSTPGYKSNRMLATTFQEEMFYRNSSKGMQASQPIGSVSMIQTADETITNYEKGNFEETGRNLDVALSGPGFLRVQTDEGIVYTRNGCFSIDTEGYLCLNEVGRVLGEDGPIQIERENFSISSDGTITEGPIMDEEGHIENLEDPNVYGKLSVVDFADYTQLERAGNGVFTTAAQPTESTTPLIWKSLEQSNVNPIDQMVSMMSSQRTLQSSAQVLKIYDQLMSKIVTEIGKI